MGAVQTIGRAARTYLAAWLRPARDMEKLAVLHGATYYLTWRCLLPHMEKLTVSLSRRLKAPSPRLFIFQLGHGNILHLTGIPRGLSSSTDYPPTKIVDATTMKIEEDVAQMGQFFQCRGGAYRLVCAV